jgi:hypothetical protein
MDIMDAAIISLSVSIIAMSLRYWKGSIFFAGVAILLALSCI